MAGKNRPLMSELNWQQGFTPGAPVTAGFLRVGLLPRNPQLAACKEPFITDKEREQQTTCPLCADGATLLKRRTYGGLSLSEIVLVDYAELELRAAASMTPEQIEAMRQEGDNEADNT